MEGKKIWQLNLQQMSQILQPVFGSHVLQCNVLLSASVKGVSKSNCFLSHQCRKPGCNLRHTLISITRLCESEVPAIKVVNGNTFHVNYCSKHTCCYFVFIIFLMATNINFVWRPFYNFRLPKGDFRKNIELEVLH